MHVFSHLLDSFAQPSFATTAWVSDLTALEPPCGCSFLGGCFAPMCFVLLTQFKNGDLRLRPRGVVQTSILGPLQNVMRTILSFAQLQPVEMERSQGSPQTTKHQQSHAQNRCRSRPQPRSHETGLDLVSPLGMGIGWQLGSSQNVHGPRCLQRNLLGSVEVCYL